MAVTLLLLKLVGGAGVGVGVAVGVGVTVEVWEAVDMGVEEGIGVTLEVVEGEGLTGVVEAVAIGLLLVGLAGLSDVGGIAGEAEGGAADDGTD